MLPSLLVPSFESSMNLAFFARTRWPQKAAEHYTRIRRPGHFLDECASTHAKKRPLPPVPFASRLRYGYAQAHYLSQLRGRWHRRVSPRTVILCYSHVRPTGVFFQANLKRLISDGVLLLCIACFRHPENGEFVHVASREDSEQAFQLVEEFKALWPGEYEVRDSEGE